MHSSEWFDRVFFTAIAGALLNYFLLFYLFFCLFQSNARRQQNSSEELPQVIFSLEELEVLKMEYNLRMPFKEYHEVRISHSINTSPNC